MKQGRKEGGKFASKSVEPREVRSVRLTNSTWEKLGASADSQCITRADLIEHLVKSGTLDQLQSTSTTNLQQVEEAVAQILPNRLQVR